MSEEIHPGITGRGGQAVLHKATGAFGITTGERKKRAETIGVIWVGKPYDVSAQLSDLIPAEYDAKPANR